MNHLNSQSYGILPVNKPKEKTSFSLVACLRRILSIKTIGHCGTLDPLAKGVMVLLIGKPFTKLSQQLITHNKQYIAKILLGTTTETFDSEGKILTVNDRIPSDEEIQKVITQFCGNIYQTPPMYSAKKINGKKLYELARKGQTVERKPVEVSLQTRLLDYSYPYLELEIDCSKGTYIRSLAHDIGDQLGCGACLIDLLRTQSGPFTLEQCIDGDKLYHETPQISEINHYLLRNIPQNISASPVQNISDRFSQINSQRFFE